MFRKLLQIASKNVVYWMATMELRTAQLTTTAQTTSVNKSVGITTVMISFQSMIILCDDRCVVQFSSN